MYNVAMVLLSVPFLERHITQHRNIIKKTNSLSIFVPWVFLGNIYEFDFAQIQKIKISDINGLKFAGGHYSYGDAGVTNDHPFHVSPSEIYIY